MGRYSVISVDAFDALQLDAGVLLTNFDVTNPYVTPASEDILATTTGGINPKCTPSYSDFAEDVDNVPKGMKEFKHLDGWDCNIQTTALGTSARLIKLSLGAADIDGQDETKIIPRRKLNQTDFESSLWWVGDKADGGLAAVQILNALSTAGFSLKTTKDGKGNISLTITGHISINNQNVVPMVFYTTEGTNQVIGDDTEEGDDTEGGGEG
jgi:hypothetical protein